MDRESLEFHIAADDFFGTAATVLDLMRQDLEKGRFRREHVSVLARMTRRLVHLQEQYRIVASGDAKSEA
jgi:hypothetical protein